MRNLQGVNQLWWMGILLASSGETYNKRPGLALNTSYFFALLVIKCIQYFASEGAYKEKTKLPVSSAFVLSYDKKDWVAGSKHYDKFTPTDAQNTMGTKLMLVHRKLM